VTAGLASLTVEAVTNSDDASSGKTDFFDDRKRFRGWARLVSKRKRPLSDLIVLDVVGAEPALSEFLAHLDKSRLVLREPTSGTTLFNFQWASGYVNGNDIRIQGILEHV
jgi:hypothetical protein